MSSGVSGSARTRYAILGCGSVGHAVAEDLTGRGKDVLILDRDESRVEALRDQDLNAACRISPTRTWSRRSTTGTSC